MNKIITILFSIIIYSNAASYEKASNYYKNNQYKLSFLEYKDLANSGNTNAQYNLGIFYYNGIGVKQDKVLAFIWLQTASKNNHKLAQNKLGYMYEKGDIPDIKNIDKALEQYHKSAIQDYELAQLNLAMIYYQRANKESYKKALYWYEKAAEKGNLAALVNIANMYYFGQYVKKDYKKAADLYLQASNKDDMLAQYNLSMMYYSGEYFEANGEKTLHWLQKSAINGYKIAQLKLANFYKEGNNSVVNKDTKKALYWYFMSAKQNHPPAQYYVGYFYFYGYSVKKNKKIAAYWMNKSKNNGYASAKRFMLRNKLYY